MISFTSVRLSWIALKQFDGPSLCKYYMPNKKPRMEFSTVLLVLTDVSMPIVATSPTRPSL